MQKYHRILLISRVFNVVKYAMSTSKFSDSNNATNINTSSKISHNPATERKMTALELQHLVRKGKKIAMITAYDYPTVLFL